MKFLFLLLLSLKVLWVWAFFNYPHNGEDQTANEVEVVDYNKMGHGTCPKIKQPLCATNGDEVLYFDNKCLLEVRNFEQLMKGLKEYFECPLSYCSPQCAPCGLVYEPVCALDVVTGEMENFPNPCEVERKICFTQNEHRIISSGQCPSNSFPPSQCPQICTLEYNPVCGQFQTELRQFPNQCQLDKDKCETNKDWQIVDLSYCVSISDNTLSSPLGSVTQDVECPEFCTLEYQPICARFMSLEKEFSNECELKTTICQTKQKWDIIRRGPCQETKSNMALDLIESNSKCPEFCTLEYNPVCAKFKNELREFANKCELETTICRNREDWSIITNGPCPSVSHNKALQLEQNPKCPQLCTLEYKPICAQLNNEMREFSNNCQLQRTICETNQKWQIVKQGTCFTDSSAEVTQCPQFCTKEYRPVCAEFKGEQREFSNKCVLLKTICETNKKWEVVKLGPCLSIKPASDAPALVSLENKCPKFCTQEYKPICAKSDQELREFPNKCELLRTNCETAKDWEIVNFGTCPSNSHISLTSLSSSANIARKLTSTPLVSCPKACSREYDPVCAKSDEELREFSNRCELQRENCESNKPWVFVNLGSCSSNSVKALSLAPLKLKEELDEPLTPPCNQFCTDDLRPICAEFDTELREFVNRCEMQRTICETKNKWKVVNEGPCPSNLQLKPDCPKFCTREFIPVCARFKEELREFPNKCEFQRSVCETNIAWELTNNGPCLIENFETDNIELQPICATDGKVKQMFNDSSDLQEEIRKTGTAWSLLHNDECLTQAPIAKASKALNWANYSSTKKSTTFATTTSTTPKTTSSTTSRATAKYSSTPITSTTTQPTTTTKANLTPTKTTTYYKPHHTTTTKTRTATTTTPKTTTTRKFSTKTKPKTTTEANLTPSKTTTYSKPQHTTTTKTITATTTNPKTTTARINKYSSTTVKPTTSAATNYPRYSPTTTSTSTEYVSAESTEYDSAESTEYDSAEINGNSNEYHEDYSICFDCSTIEDFEAYSEENENDEVYVTWKDDEEDDKNEELEEDDTSEPYDAETYTIDTTNSYRGYSKGYDASERPPEKIIDKEGSYARKDNAENIYLETSNGRERSDGVKASHSKLTIENSKKKSISAKPKGKQEISSNNNVNSGPVKKVADSLSSGNQKNTSDNSKLGNPKTLVDNKGRSGSNKDDLKEYVSSKGENMVKERLREELGNQKPYDLLKETQGNKQGVSNKQRDKIKPKLEKSKVNSNIRKHQQVKAISDQANVNLKTEQRLQILANPGQSKSNSNADLYNPENDKDIGNRVQENYGNLGQSNLNLNTEQQVQAIAYQGQTNLNSVADLYIPEYNKGDEGNVESNTNQEQSGIDSESILYKPEYYEGPKDNDKDDYEDLLSHFHDNEKDTPQVNTQEEKEGASNLYEKDPKFGVYSDKAYGLMDTAEITKDDEWSRQNQAKESQYNNENIENIYNEINANNNNYQDDGNTQDYSRQSSANSTENTEKILEVFEALLSESDNEEEDDETLVKQVLTTLGSDTTTAYPLYEKIENQSNYTKREEYPYKYNNTKKGEIYNGAVYKAPVYDAPTYNFIYTAPNHPVMPLMSNNRQHHPFLQYSGFMPQYTDPAANPYSPFVPLVNQSNLGTVMEVGPGINKPFNPMQFLTSLAAMSSPLGSPMTQPQSSEYNSNQQPETQINPLDIQGTPSQLPSNPSSPAVYNQILPQTHPLPHMFLPPPPEPFLNSFPHLTNIASRIPNDYKQRATVIEDNLNNTPTAEGNEADLSQYSPYPVPNHPIYNNPVNPQMQQPLPFVPHMASLPYLQPPAPFYYPPHAGQLPLNVFNATLIQEIADTLKTITSGY